MKVLPMKNILLCISILLMASLGMAQTSKPTNPPPVNEKQAEMDNAMQQMQGVIKNLPPELQEQIKKSTGKTSSANLSSKPSEVNNPTEIGSKISKIIGPEGGELNSANGKITLKFPVDAVSQKTEISIQETENTLETGNGNAFQILPEGLQFRKPVKLIIKYSKKEIEGSDPDDLNIITQGTNGEWFLNMTSEVDTIKNYISANIKHFSKWGFGSVKKLKLLPSITTLAKGQVLTLSIEKWTISPKNMDLDESNFKELIKKEKELFEFRAAKNEYMIKKKEDEILALTIKLKIDNHNLNLDPNDDDLIALKNPEKSTTMFGVTDWLLNNVKAPVSNSYGTLAPQGFTARYTAPKIIPSQKTVIISANLISKNQFDNKYFRYELTSTIILLDNGYLNYTVDGKETKTLQFGFSSEYRYLVKEKKENVFDDATATCIFADGVLSFGTGTAFAYTDKQIFIFFNLKNPGIGQNLINADDAGSSWRNHGRVMVSIGKLGDDGAFTNSEIQRERTGSGGCIGRNIGRTFELTLTEFEGKDKGIAAGTFSGTVYEDNDILHKNCENTIPHFVTGNFSLIIQTPNSKEIEDLTKTKYNPSEYKAPSEQFDKDSQLEPLTPKPKTESKSKTTAKPKTK